MTKTQREWIDGLRKLADWAEKHPDSSLLDQGLNHYGFVYDDAVTNLAKAAKAFGHAEKSKTDNYFNVVGRFGPHKMEVTSPRENVCVRTVVGVEEIPEKIIPEQVIPAKTVEVVEWVCPESLLASVS